MKRSLKQAKWFILGLLAVLLLAGCTATNNDEPAASGGSNADPGTDAVQTEPKVLTFSMTAEPGTLDSNKSVDEMANVVLFHISEGLVRSYNNEIYPAIAEKWDVSEDGKTYTFHLRESVWSDGVPLTAHDFEYTFKRFLDPATGSSFVEKFYAVLNAEPFNKGEMTDAGEVGIRALDDHTLEIELEYAVPYFLNTLGTNSYFYPVRQDVVEEHGVEYAADETKIVTNGPFILEKWSHEAEIRMVKNDNYWNKDAINLDGITMLIIPDGNTAANMFDMGQLDFLSDIPVALAPKYPDAEYALAGGVQMLQFNIDGATPESKPVMANLNFRKALSYAVNRQNIASAVAAPGTQPANRFVQPMFKSYVEANPFDGMPAEGDVELAKEYLQKALDELGMTIDELPKLTFVGMEGRNRVYGEALQDAWAKTLGLNNIEIQILPVSQAIGATMERKYDIYVQSLAGSRDASEIMEYWLAHGSINWTGWNDETYTEMYNNAMRIVDEAERDKALFEVEQYLFDHGPLSPFLFPGSSYAVRDGVTGVVKASVGASNQLIYADISN